MSGPENETPKKTTAKKAPAQKTPAEEPAEAAPAAPAGPSQTAQATAAASAAVSNVREKLVAGEQFALAAAGSIVLVVYLLFKFLLDYRLIVDDFSVLLAVLTVLAIWVHRWGHYDFGPAYRIIIAGLALSLALLAFMNLLAWARLGGGSGDFLGFIGRLIYWASAVAAGYGGWLVFRIRED